MRDDIVEEVTPDAFRERFALATFAEGGIVVDLSTGGYSRLNSTGALFLAALQAAASTAAATEVVARRAGLSLARAAEDMRALVVSLSRGGVRIEGPGPMMYRPKGGGGYDLFHGVHRALHVDSSARRLTLCSAVESLPLPIFAYVSEIGPKLLSMQGVPVLHGSSCQHGGGALVMCGKSRAGKTTTARVFAKNGRSLVSEDLIVLDDDLDYPGIFVEAETKIRQWFKEASAELTRRNDAEVDLAPLREAATGATVPMKTLWFLDAKRRQGDRFAIEGLSEPDALAQLMDHAFLGSVERESWRRYVAAGHSIISAVSPYRAYLPDGLERLEAAIQRYSTNSAS
jgi:hypothetical protein